MWKVSENWKFIDSRGRFREIFFCWARIFQMRKDILSRIRSDGHQGQLVHKSQKHGVREDMNCILSQNWQMLMGSNLKPSIGLRSLLNQNTWIVAWAKKWYRSANPLVRCSKKWLKKHQLSALKRIKLIPTHGTEYRTYRTPNTEYRIPNTEYWIPNTEYRLLITFSPPAR